MDFHHIKGLKVSIEIFANSLLIPTGLFSSWMWVLQVHLPNAQQRRKDLFNKHKVPHALDNPRHFS
jgi:hypothetical protein